MGYEVHVHGKVELCKPIEELYENVSRDDAPYSIGYFIINFNWADDRKTFNRYGKLWYDMDEVIEYLSKFLNGTIWFHGEDNNSWKYVIKDGNITFEKRSAEW